MTAQQVNTINGIDPNELQELVSAISQDSRQAQLAFQATTSWADGPRSVTRMKSFEWAGQLYARDFTLTIDEPEELGGTNMGPNPQEVLLAGLNSCILATFVDLCSLQGITLESVEITSIGKLDLRGLFQMDETVTPGYQDLRWNLKVKGNASPEQLQQIYEMTIASSPNFWNMANPVAMKPELQIET